MRVGNKSIKAKSFEWRSRMTNLVERGTFSYMTPTLRLDLFIKEPPYTRTVRTVV